VASQPSSARRSPQRSLPERSVLVTGASSGIGAAFARKLAERGYRVGLVARSEDKMRELTGAMSGEPEIFTCDLGDPAARERLVDDIRGRGLDVGILVNNAGFGVYKDFVESDRQRELEQLHVTVEAVVDLTHRFLPAMVERGRGAVINTSSTSAFQPIPGNAGYAAAKAYVLALGEALHEETRKAGVTVTTLCPGPVHTGFQDASEAHDFAKTLPKPMWRDADTVAEAGIRGAERGKRLVVPGAPNRVSGAMARFSPRPVLLRALRASSS
jgi:short-subunit dehydrogenase